jgi:plastocyanin
MVGAGAADPTTRGFDVHADRFEVPGTTSNSLDLYVGEWVTWTVWEGEHTVTPVNKAQWGDGGEEGLKPDSERYTAKNFKAPGTYKYYCETHGDLGANNQPVGMWGQIVVTDPSATTTTTAPATTPPPTTAPAAPTTTTTRPTSQTTAPPASSAGTHTPTSAAPAPTTTSPAKTDKNKKPAKEEETTTTTTVPAPPPPVDIPDSAIIPTLPGFDAQNTTGVQDGAIAEAPGSTPEGEAIALLKGKKRGGNGVKLLIASSIGLGALGLGTAGYKFANRSSKYFPA